MFGIRRPSEDRLIDAGRVGCPLRERDADIELCLQCDWLRKVELEGKLPCVRCHPPRTLLVLP